MDTKNIFSEILLELRSQKKISRQQLADELQISRASLEYYEKAKRVPDVEVLANISKYFNVSSDYLLGLDECKTPENEEIHKLLGLSDLAIERLKNVTEFEKTWFARKLRALNYLIENINNSKFLTYLYDYIFCEFAFPIPDDPEHVYKSTEVVSGDGYDRVTFLFSADEINDLYYSKLQQELVQMKNKAIEEMGI